MSDTPSRAPSAEPDFLDRLLARHTAPRPDAVRVRPRLPGPFERVEAVRSRTPEPDTDPVAWPTAAPTAVPERESPRPAPADVRRHTERERTVVHMEREPADAVAHPAPPALSEAPLLRPVAPLATPRPVPPSGSRTAGAGRPEPGADRAAASLPVPPGTDAAPAALLAAARPSAADTTAAREAVRQAAARRPARSPEQVVRVQIGRLEVTAGSTPPRNGTRPPTRSGERPGAALSLAEYLARGRE
ncbi:hypothetical protein ACWCQN_03625 [Streptomyces sp. NPDC001984]